MLLISCLIYKTGQFRVSILFCCRKILVFAVPHFEANYRATKPSDPALFRFSLQVHLPFPHPSSLPSLTIILLAHPTGSAACICVYPCESSYELCPAWLNTCTFVSYAALWSSSSPSIWVHPCTSGWTPNTARNGLHHTDVL